LNPDKLDNDRLRKTNKKEGVITMKKLTLKRSRWFFFICLLLCAYVPLMAQRGADISWWTEMEASGYSWKDSCGQQADLLDILKAFNINAIRLRVWVNPSGGWSGKDDVVNKARRVKNAGMDLMIAFHYSDSWADPGKQNKPSAWSSYGIDQLVDAVYNHTRDVMSALQSAGCNPRWVGIGNETNNGMLWPDGRAEDHMSNYARLVTSGHNAVKDTTGSTTIVHVSNGWDTDLFNWNIGGLLDNGAQFDMVGMSLYPGDWSSMVSNARNTVSAMNSRGKNVIVCEVGMEVSAASACKSFISSTLSNLGSAFYWEPECMGFNGYSKGAWNNDGTPTIALEGYGGNGCGSGSGSTPEPTSPPQVTPDPTREPTQTQVPTVEPTTTPTAPPSSNPGNGSGLLGEYFDGTGLSNLVFTRIDPVIDMNWGDGSPDSSIQADNFSIRWTGKIEARMTETYTITTRSDDGMRVWINNQQIINDWNDHTAGPDTEASGTIAMQMGQQYEIRVEYYEASGEASAQLYWSNSYVTREIIPQSQLYSEEIPEETLGDVNDDGAINIVDALLVAQYYVGLNPANFNGNRADVNCDGTINIVDALLIAQYYVGLVDHFC
jgi:arabinogalactan endo-1,4-beta-galactosidase